MRRALPLSALLAAALLAGGCGSGDDSASGTTAAGGETVALTASEYTFDPSDPSVDAAGKVTFRVTNDGGQTHALEIEGNGVEEETEKIAPGESATLTVDLKQGKYEFYCPIDGHRDKGMEGDFVVGGAAGAGSGTSTGEDDTTETDEGSDYGG